MKLGRLLARLFPGRGRHAEDPDDTVTLPGVTPWGVDPGSEDTRLDIRRDRPYVRRDPPDMIP
jgi:hypothetical protein